MWFDQAEGELFGLILDMVFVITGCESQIQWVHFVFRFLCIFVGRVVRAENVVFIYFLLVEHLIEV